MRRSGIVFLLVLGFFTLSLAIGPDELPFGSHYMDTSYTSAQLGQLDSLCFNYFVEYRNILNGWRIDSLYAHHMQAVRGGLISLGDTPPYWDAEAPAKYSWTCYAEMDVGFPYPNPEVCMMPYGGDLQEDSWVSSRGSKDTLSGLSTWEDLRATPKTLRNGVRFNSGYFFPFFGQDRRISYTFDIYMSVDDSLPGDTSSFDVAYVTFEVGGDGRSEDVNICKTDTLQVDTIRAADCRPYGEINPRQISFVFPDSTRPIVWKYAVNGNCDSTVYDTVRTDGTRAYFLFFDITTTGKRMVTVDKIVIYDEYGRNLVEPPHWYDPEITSKFQEYQSRAEKIYGWYLMDEPLFANYRPFDYIQGLMKNVHSDWTLPVFVQGSTPTIHTVHSYLSIVQPDVINPDLYPFGADNPYCGLSYQNDWGPWARYNEAVFWMRSRIDQENRADAFWVTFQTFGTNQWGGFRLPTASELSCETFTTLAWGAKGLGMWWYQDPSSGTGILYANGARTPLYGEIKDHIGPYIQAVDEYYMPLTWERCYVYHAGTPVHDPPGEAFVGSISAYSDSFNPDLGWFQVGEYHDSLSARYLMLVNRGCNIDSVTPAPPVTATVRFNPSTIGSDYVFINDLAHTVHYDSVNHEWVGDSLVTYSAKMPDGTIPFTTTLRTGEGRLFRIAGTSEKVLQGSISTEYAYQGRIRIQDDATVPGGDTMRVVGPARLEVARCDSVQLIVNGRLEATGALADSVKFVSDTTASCDHGPHPLPGDWYGIHFMPGSHGVMNYCAIRYGVIGADIDNLAEVKVDHSLISHNSISGFDTYKSYFDLTNSRVDCNSIYGVHSYYSADSIYNCKLCDNGQYGIYLDTQLGIDSCFVLYDTITFSQPPLSLLDGIHIRQVDAVRVFKCQGRDYSCGIVLDGSDARVTNCSIPKSTSKGIYAYNSSYPFIRQCFIDSVSIAVATLNTSRPNLGTANDYGRCTLKGTS